MEDPEDTLPSIIEDSPPDLPAVAETSTEQEVNACDLLLANFQLTQIANLWSEVSSISAACKLISSTIEATKHRRAILQMPYGSPNKVSKTFEIPTLDWKKNLKTVQGAACSLEAVLPAL